MFSETATKYTKLSEEGGIIKMLCKFEDGRPETQTRFVRKWQDG